MCVQTMCADGVGDSCKIIWQGYALDAPSESNHSISAVSSS